MRATRNQQSRQEVQASRHGRKFKFITQIKFRHSKNHLFYLIFYRKNAFKTISPERKFQKRFIIDKYKNILYDNIKEMQIQGDIQRNIEYFWGISENISIEK